MLTADYEPCLWETLGKLKRNLARSQNLLWIILWYQTKLGHIIFIRKQKKFIELNDTDYTTFLKFKVIWSIKTVIVLVLCGWKVKFVTNYLLNGFTNGRKCYNDKLYRLKMKSRKKKSWKFQKQCPSILVHLSRWNVLRCHGCDKRM